MCLQHMPSYHGAVSSDYPAVQPFKAKETRHHVLDLTKPSLSDDNNHPVSLTLQLSLYDTVEPFPLLSVQTLAVGAACEGQLNCEMSCLKRFIVSEVVLH